MPAFSTTTDTDKVVASIIMMGALQKFFSYRAQLTCGIPSVTLLGVQEDWQEILRRIEKLPALGSEPRQFYNLLKPIVTRFVSSFDNPDAPETIDFWQKIAHKHFGGSGPDYLSGWITAFLFWKEDGDPLYRPPVGEVQSRPRSLLDPGCCLDNTLYHVVKVKDIPSGHASVPLLVDDNGVKYNTIMVAGSVAIRVTSSGEALDVTNTHANNNYKVNSAGEWELVEYQPGLAQATPGLDSLQPESGWWMFETNKPSKDEESETAPIKSNSSSSATKLDPLTE